MLVPQELLETMNPALAVTLLSDSAVLRRLVTVTFLAELVLFTVTVPKLRELAENVTGALPVPDKFTTWGLFPALSVNVSVPVAEPTVAGENVTPTLQFFPEAMLAPQVLLAIENPVLATMLVKLSGEV